MKSDQFIAALLLGLVPQTMAVPVLVEFAHAPAPAIRVDMDLNSAGGLVKFPDTHNQYMESRKEADRFRAQVTPPDTAPIPFTFGPKDDQVESSHIGESADFTGFGSLPSNGKVNRKVYDVGSQALPERELRGVDNVGGVVQIHKGGSQNGALVSYMWSLIGLSVNLPFLRRLLTN